MFARKQRVLAAFLAATIPIPTSLPATLYVVGDLMYYGTESDTEMVGRFMSELLTDNPHARGMLLGDVCNWHGEAECYQKLERTSWGPILPKLYAVPGNHDYEMVKNTGGIPFFFNYTFNHGVRGEGWQAFDWGGWRVIPVNSEIMGKNAQGKLSLLALRQLDFMERELRERSNRQCVLVAYHRPMFSSGRFASPGWVGPLFNKSFKYGVDLTVTAHEHMFAVLPPLRPVVGAEPVVDKAYGIPPLIAGTGGALAHSVPRQPKWSETIISGVPGLVRLDLYPGGYRWEFLPVPERREAGRIYPSGEGRCHDNPSGYVEPRVE